MTSVLRSVATGDETLRAFRAEVLAGMSEPQKAIPAHWLYDMRGSQLFEQITRLPEYYPTRVETALLTEYGKDIAELTGTGRAVVEFGSGSSVKTPLLLRNIAPCCYMPIDISGEFLQQSVNTLAAEFPDLPILPIEANMLEPVALPDHWRSLPMLGFFPGSTIGNRTPASSVDLLRTMRTTLGTSSQLLIGFDLLKDMRTLLAAYDDAQGITAEFNCNLLQRINRELRTHIPVECFSHQICWNPDWNRIEMHLQAQSDLSFDIAHHHFSMKAGDTIHTENSHKYTPGEARLLLQAGGWSLLRGWTDRDEAFLVILAEATPLRSAP